MIDKNSSYSEKAKMKNKLLIGLDIDGVCLDFLSRFLQIHNLRNKTRLIPSDILKFMPSGDLDNLITEDEWNESFEYFEANGTYATLNRFEGVRTSINNILSANHDIVFVTARNYKFKGETEVSFMINGLPNKRIYFCPKGKYKIFKKLNLDIYVDDNINNCNDALKAGISQVYIMDQPYNRVEEANQFKRINSLIQLERDILSV